MAELLNTENPELIRARLAYGPQVAMVAAARRENGIENSAYDRFMVELVGHPLAEDYKPVIHPNSSDSAPIILPYRPVKMVTDTCVAVLRSTVPYPTRPEEMLVVFADLEQQRYGVLPVREIIHSKDYTRTQEFILGEPDDFLESPRTISVLADGSVDPLNLVNGGCSQVKMRAEQRARCPRLVLGIQRAGFQKPGGSFELYAGRFEDFHRDLVAYEAYEVTYEKAQQEVPRTVTIAA